MWLREARMKQAIPLLPIRSNPFSIQKDSYKDSIHYNYMPQNTSRQQDKQKAWAVYSLMTNRHKRSSIKHKLSLSNLNANDQQETRITAWIRGTTLRETMQDRCCTWVVVLLPMFCSRRFTTVVHSLHPGRVTLSSWCSAAKISKVPLGRLRSAAVTSSSG